MISRGVQSFLVVTGPSNLVFSVRLLQIGHPEINHVPSCWSPSAAELLLVRPRMPPNEVVPEVVI